MARNRVTNTINNLEPPKKDWTEHPWALVFHTLAQIARYFNRTALANKLYLRARDFCVLSQDYYGGAYMAEEGGDIEGAIFHYTSSGCYERAKLLAGRYRIPLPPHYPNKVRAIE